MVTRGSENAAIHRSYPCECCGFWTLTDPATNSYEICPVCFWENDPVQSEDPLFAGGANVISLSDARENYSRFGACESRFADQVRPPGIDDVPYPRVIAGLDSANRAASVSATSRLLLGIARSILSGTIGILDGCAAIASVAFPLNEPELNDALRFFAIVAGEADEFPSGETRRLWAPEALKAKDKEAGDYERRVRSDVNDACRRLKQLLEAKAN